MKSLRENEMIDALIQAAFDGKLDKRFCIVGFKSGTSKTHSFNCEVVKYSNNEAIIKAPCLHGEVAFQKSSLDNRFYGSFNGFTYALCLSAKEADEISKIHSDSNAFLLELTEKMKFLTSEELQSIAIYIEGCFERRLQ